MAAEFWFNQNFLNLCSSRIKCFKIFSNINICHTASKLAFRTGQCKTFRSSKSSWKTYKVCKNIYVILCVLFVLRMWEYRCTRLKGFIICQCCYCPKGHNYRKLKLWCGKYFVSKLETIRTWVLFQCFNFEWECLDIFRFIC